MRSLAVQVRNCTPIARSERGQFRRMSYAPRLRGPCGGDAEPGRYATILFTCTGASPALRTLPGLAPRLLRAGRDLVLAAGGQMNPRAPGSEAASLRNHALTSERASERHPFQTSAPSPICVPKRRSRKKRRPRAGGKSSRTRGLGLVGETGFEPATPWSRTGTAGIPQRVFGWHRIARTGNHGWRGAGRFGWRGRKRMC